MNAITSTSLYFPKGNLHQEYHVAVRAEGQGYVVTFDHGESGSPLTTGSKTPVSVTLERANAIHDELVLEKTAQGYRPVRCQLLNRADESELLRLLNDDTHCLQQKLDGRRMMIRKTGTTIIGFNLEGRVVAVPNAILDAVADIDGDCLIDGEEVGDELHVFDILESNGIDCREREYGLRCGGVVLMLLYKPPGLQIVDTCNDADAKLAMFRTLREQGCEGVVFKDWYAPHSPGRPASGGTQLQHKFAESPSFIPIWQDEPPSGRPGLLSVERFLQRGS